MIAGRRQHLRSPVAPVYCSPIGASRAAITGSGGVVSPDDVSGLTHWYDASEITASDGDSIGTWADQEGSADLTQSTSSKQPTYQTSVQNGNAIVRFDGTDDLLTVSFSALSQANHVFIVCDHDSDSSNSFDSDDSNNRHALGADGSSQWLLFAGSTITDNSYATGFELLTGLFNGANSTLRIDGSQTASGDAGSDGLGGITVGAQQGDQNHADTDIGEVLVYNTELPTNDRDDIEEYLADKWGISI